jgi:hypothetical protein
MKAETVKRILLAIAAVALIIIWSRNLLLFFPHQEDVKPNATVVTTSMPSEKSRAAVDRETTFVFADDLRDPFQIPQPQSVPSDDAKRKPIPQPPPEPPRASLIGIVWNAKLPQVVVFDSVSNGSVILSERQSINGYQVRSISKSQVVLQSKRQKVVWKAND